MTDRDRLLSLLNNCETTTDITSILKCFLYTYGEDLSIQTVNNLYKQVGELLDYKIGQANSALFVAKERAGYLKKYLDGSMWKDEETAKRHLEPQIENAQAILDAVKQVR